MESAGPRARPAYLRPPGAPSRFVAGRRRARGRAPGHTPCGGQAIVPKLRFVFFGLSITSSWRNGHANTYSGLAREFKARGHDVLFLERDVPWYASNRDLAKPPYGATMLYK